MESNIIKNNGILEVTLKNIGEAKSRVLESLSLCQAGKCNCQTKEYEKLEKMEIEEGDNNLVIKLYPKDGMDLDINEVNKCIDTLK